MKRPNPAPILPSPRAARRPPRTRAEAAMELVRVEFERERLERDLLALARREAAAEAARETCVTRGRSLRSRLADGDAPAGTRR